MDQWTLEADAGETFFVAAADDDDDAEKSTCWQKLKENCGPGSSGFALGLITTYVLICTVLCESYKPADWLTMLYVLVQILTTIGYGDIGIPKEHRFAAMMFIFFGIVLVANAFNGLGSRFLETKRRRMRHVLRTIEVKAVASINNEKQALLYYGHLNELLSATCMFLFFLLSGAVFYRLVEACTCSYGETHVAGCKEGDQCYTTGGYQKDWIDAVYMSVITLTTIGFGDVVPRSRLGRTFGVFWMVLGVISMGNFVGALATCFDAATEKKPKPKFSRKLFMEIDKDKDNAISFPEFCTWALVSQGLITTGDLDALHRAFNSMDINKTKKLEYEILARQFQHDVFKNIEEEDEDEDGDEDEESEE